MQTCRFVVHCKSLKCTVTDMSKSHCRHFVCARNMYLLWSQCWSYKYIQQHISVSVVQNLGETFSTIALLLSILLLFIININSLLCLNEHQIFLKTSHLYYRLISIHKTIHEIYGLLVCFHFYFPFIFIHQLI